MKLTVCFKHVFMAGIIAIIGFLLSFSVADAYTLSTARVQYRNHTSPGSHTRVYFMFKDESDNYVNPNVSDVRITYTGNEIETGSLWGAWINETASGNYNENTGQWEFISSSRTYYYMRVGIAPSSDFADADAPAGTYSLSIDTDDGTYTRDLSFNGKQELPAIDSTSFQSSYKSGDLTISWTLPHQSQFPSNAKLSLYIDGDDNWVDYEVFTMPTTINSITIPQETLELIGKPRVYNVTMRTEITDSSSSNRFYSDTVTIIRPQLPVAIPSLLLDK